MWYCTSKMVRSSRFLLGKVKKGAGLVASFGFPQLPPQRVVLPIRLMPIHACLVDPAAALSIQDCKAATSCAVRGRAKKPPTLSQNSRALSRVTGQLLDMMFCFSTVLHF